MPADALVDLDIATDRRGDTSIIRVVGELDIGTAPRLIATVHDLVGQGMRRIELDCSAVDFVDSAGVRALIVSRNEATQHGAHLDVTATSASMSRVLDMTGLSSLLAPSPV